MFLFTGKDELSVQFAETIESAEISSRLEQEHFVAIKIESGTETYRFFAQICILLLIVIGKYCLLIVALSPRVFDKNEGPLRIPKFIVIENF